MRSQILSLLYTRLVKLLHGARTALGGTRAMLASSTNWSPQAARIISDDRAVDYKAN